MTPSIYAPVSGGVLDVAGKLIFDDRAIDGNEATRHSAQRSRQASSPETTSKARRTGSGSGRRDGCTEARHNAALLRHQAVPDIGSCRCRSSFLAAFEQAPQVVIRTALAVILRRRFDLLTIFSDMGKMRPVRPMV